jgi:hypothetical protein
VRPEGLRKIPISRDIQACRVVPQPLVPPHAPAASIPSLRFPSQVLITVRFSDGHSGVVDCVWNVMAVVMLDTPCSEVVWRVLATHSIRQFPPSLPLPCVTVCHHISTGLYTRKHMLPWKDDTVFPAYVVPSRNRSRSMFHCYSQHATSPMLHACKVR